MSASPRLWHRPLRGLSSSMPLRGLSSSMPLRGLLAAAAAAALVACGGDGDATTTATATTPAPATTLSGVAAVGSPIANGSVNVSCAGGAALPSTTTSADGAWQVTTTGQTLPCAVQVRGGTVDGAANALALHSVAFDFGNLNVTPLTDLVFARAVAGSPQTWFATPAFSGLTSTNVNAALTQIANALGINGALAGRNPLVASFKPQTGDPLDDLLTALSSALHTLGSDFAALLAAAGANNFAAFAALPGAIATAQAGGGSGGSCSTGVAMVFDRGQAAGPFANAQQVCVVASPTSLKIDSRAALGNPTPNTNVSAPYAAYVFADAGLNYEVVFNNGALYEINVAKPNAISAADFHGQFKPAAGSGGAGVTLTVEVAISGVAGASFTVPNQTPPADQAEFCADPANNPNLLGLQAQNGVTLTVTGCSFAGNVGTIQATAQNGGISVPYVVRFVYGS